MLAAGGNALDAVIACALTQGVVDPMMCGVGGLGSLNLYDPATRRNVVFDGLSTCPSASTPDMWEKLFERECSDGYGYVLTGGVNELGHAAVTTPGIMRVFGEAHAGFGKLPWAELFAPAISPCRDGVDDKAARLDHVHARREGLWAASLWSRSSRSPRDGRKLYLRPDSTPKRVGEEGAQPRSRGDLAQLGARRRRQLLHR